MPKLPQGCEKRGKSYQIRFRYDCKRYSVSATTLPEAIEKKEKKIELLKAHVRPDASKITFGEFWKEYLNNKHIKPSTLKSYTKKYKWIQPYLEDVPLLNIDRRLCKTLQKALSEHLATSSTNYAMSMLRGCLREAVNCDLMPKNPAEGIKAL